MFHFNADGVNMRKPTTPVAATKATPSAAGRGDTPVELVCLALALAVLTLAFRIARLFGKPIEEIFDDA